MKKLIFLIFLFATLNSFSENQIIKATPKLFIDCDGCDENYNKEKIKFVDFVRDRADADIYIMLNYQMTGSGGKKYYLDFIGKNQFEGINDTIIYTIPNSTTHDFRRNKIVEKINLGLARYLLKTEYADSITINHLTQSTESTSTKAAINDPWDYWVFSVDLNSYFNGEKSSSSLSTYSDISADRVTNDWKFSLGMNFNYSESKYLYEDVEYLTLTRSRSAYSNIIKSLDNNFSAGIWTNYNQNTYNNILHNYTGGLGVEYSVFPYSEANRVAIKFQYRANTKYNIYEEETIYLKTKEILFDQNINMLTNLKQTWGNIYFSLSWHNYFNDFSKNSFSAYSNFSVNLVKGLNLNFSASYSSIHDQMTLRRAGTSIEDLLLRRKQLATQYSYWGSFGLSYTFGSIYSNFVNTRF